MQTTGAIFKIFLIFLNICVVWGFFPVLPTMGIGSAIRSTFSPKPHFPVYADVFPVYQLTALFSIMVGLQKLTQRWHINRIICTLQSCGIILTVVVEEVHFNIYESVSWRLWLLTHMFHGQSHRLHEITLNSFVSSAYCFLFLKRVISFVVVLNSI